jgi:hypothetical protein
MSFTPVNATTFRDELGDSARISHATVTVGDEREQAFKPHLLAGKWDDEYWFSLSWRMPPVISDQFNNTNGLLELDTNRFTYRNYVLNDNVVEIEIELKQAPVSNQLVFDVEQSRGIGWHYQGAVTEEDGLWDDEHEAWIAPNRPERVVGSYALYVEKDWTADQKYRSGKLAHLYSWEAVDADESRVVLPLVYDDVAETLTIAIPQDYLDKAVYPVLVVGNGDTIGFASCGGSTQGISSDWLFCSGDTDGGYDIGSAGTYNIDGWGNSCGDSNQASALFKACLYDDDGASPPEPNSRHSYHNEVDADDETNCDADSTPCALATYPDNGTSTLDGVTKYWVCLLSEGGNYDLYYDSVANYKNEYKTGQTYADPPAASWPSGSTSWDGQKVTAFIDYTEQAGGLSIPVAMHHYKQMAGN